MATLPPWLQAPDVLKIMESGSRTGLAARKQAADELEAADRLSLAYASLASQEARSSEETQARLADSRARREQAQQTAQSLEDYRRQSLAQRGLDQQLKAMNQLRMADQFKAGQQAVQGRFDTAQQALQDRFDLGMQQRKAHEERLARLNKERADEFAKREQRIMSTMMDPVKRAELGVDIQDLRNVKKRIDEYDKAGGPSWRILPYPSRRQYTEYEKLQKEKADLEGKIKSYSALSTSPGATEKQITPDIAKKFLDEAKGDKEAARKLARAAGYTF